MKARRPLLFAVLAALLVLPTAAAQRVDLLKGEIGRSPVCGAGLEELAGELGVPSHRVASDAGTRLRFVHLGVEIDLDGDGRAVRVVVYALPDGEVRGFPAHFLGPVSNGTRQAPIVRLLKGAGLRLEQVDPDLVRALSEPFHLELAFREGYILQVRLTCAGTPVDVGGP